MRVALYARCSTADQSVDLQLDGLRDYAKVRGFTVVEEYVDEAVSGARPRLTNTVIASSTRTRVTKCDVLRLYGKMFAEPPGCPSLPRLAPPFPPPPNVKTLSAAIVGKEKPTR